MAATILDLQIRFEHNDEIEEKEEEQGKGHDMIIKGWKKWLAMMPKKDCLRASLPIHWAEDIISQSKCTALELNIDASYFARAEAISDLVSAIKVDESDGTCSIGIDITKYEDNMEQIANDIFDIVQTRSCRAERIDGSMQIIRPSLRILAPIFDFINHGSCHHEGIGSANAYFGLEEGNDDGGGEEEGADLFLVVRARRDIDTTTDEVLIDYGDSTRPAWRCLASYGFVPEYRKDEEEDNESVAEVYMDGVRYEVTSHTVPYEMVEAASASYLGEIQGPSALLLDDDNVENDYENETILTPELALRIAKRVSDAAFQLLIDPQKDEVRSSNDAGGNCGEDSESSIDIAKKLASSLRLSQHQVLLACALGLRDYAGTEDLE